MRNEIRGAIDALAESGRAGRDGLKALIALKDQDETSYLRSRAAEASEKVFSRAVYLRGLIEFTNYCKNDCLYCGIRRSNAACDRYRLTADQIVGCADQGYELGFRTIVLQGGEDMTFSRDDICRIISRMKENHPDAAVTLSVGERDRESYKAWFDAGADRYLLREETGNAELYKKLHPAAQTWENRIRCLYDLKDIGYQVGCGFMVGAPYQTADDIVDELEFYIGFRPHMIGIGPFIPHKDTPFAGMPAGTADMTLNLISILRLMFPDALLPATTALGTISPRGREDGILAGANVVMPNLSPAGVRAKYLLYDGKICTGDEAAECRFCMERRIESVGHHVEVSRGDHPSFRK